MAERFLGKRQLQFAQLLIERIAGLADPEAEIERDLIVARARGVEPPGGRPDELGKARLDIHVNVFERAREFGGARLDLAPDLLEAAGDRFPVLFRDDARFDEHGGVRLRTLNVLLGKPIVEANRRVDFLHDRVRAACEPAAPHFIGHLVLLIREGCRHDRKEISLAGFKGRTVLFNLWATWCVPCRQEMPALDRVQGALGSPKFSVVAVNIDTTRLDRTKAFLDETGIKNLTYYSHHTAGVFQALKQEGLAFGLPATILIGKDGCAIGNMAGPAQWDSEEASALLKAAQG